MNDFLFILAIVIACIFFAGEPDLHDALIERVHCKCSCVEVTEE